MRSFRFYVETEPGLLVRRTDTDHVKDEMLRLAPILAQHYQRFWAIPELKETRAKRYQHVLSLGGGHPSFEANGLQAEAITVVDLFADVYEGVHDVFVKENQGAPKVTYVKGDMRTASMEGADCITFCHVLEHLTLADAAAVLRQAGSTRADIVIYGPNSDCMQSDTWLHALPVHEHIWLGGLDWTVEWVEHATGRQVTVKGTNDYDLFLVLPDPVASDAGTVAEPEAAPEPKEPAKPKTKRTGKGK